MKGKTALLFLLAGLFYSCNHIDNDDKTIFHYNESAGINTLDPAFAKDQAHIWVCSQLYNSLVALDTNLEPQPALAKRWEISDDGKQYTFILRDDVYFHTNPLFGHDSTRRVLATDVLYSLNRIIDERVASPGRWIFSEVADNGFKAVDDTTFIVLLKEPFAPFLSLLSMAYCSVVPHEVVDYYGDDFRRHACGTGPFCLQWWEEGEKLVMRKNPRYFERDEAGTPLPYLDAVAITFIIDKQTAFLEFIKGNMDFMNSIDAGYKDEILTRTGQLKPKYAERIRMESTPYLNTEYLGFRMDCESVSPLRDRRIRQAINMGFDRTKMMKYLRNNIGEPGQRGIVPPGIHGGCRPTVGYSYNPQKAMQLLAEAGYPGGKGLPALKMATTSGYLDLCKYIQQQLGLIGIEVLIDVHPPAALREAIAQGKTDWFRGSWIADYPDAQNYLSLFYSDNFAPNGPNYTHFKNAEFDRLYRDALNESNPQFRLEKYRMMDSLVMIEAPVVVLYYDQILHFTHKNISGLRSNAMNALDLRRVKKKT